VIGKARAWSRDAPLRRAAVLFAGAAVLAGAVWAWWPAGQYQPVRADQGGTLPGMIRLVSAPGAVARPAARTGQVSLAPGSHLAVAMIPVGGATRSRPALFVIPGKKGQPAVALISTSTPDPSTAPGGTGASPQNPSATTTTTTTAPSQSGSSSSMSSSPADATAFGQRDARYELAMVSIWRDPADDPANVRWARDLSDVLRPTGTGGTYVNQIGLEAEEGTEGIRAAFGKNYDRLLALKAKYDPTNFFRHNQNIVPAR